MEFFENFPCVHFQKSGGTDDPKEALRLGLKMVKLKEEEHWCQMMDQKEEDDPNALVKCRNVLDVVLASASHFGLSLIHRSRRTKIWLALHMWEKLNKFSELDEVNREQEEMFLTFVSVNFLPYKKRANEIYNIVEDPKRTSHEPSKVPNNFGKTLR
ncbi:hypothetical protein Bca52824_015952 [Brassica carinata]|uniref:Uncharacterized protein n=1 Tax=Brassica carinata TaxID=52824 RepID=A0A8X7W2W7_BRACI|nr:hypothetical protein Bca52824_015952 [Brassica carinata]